MGTNRWIITALFAAASLLLIPGNSNAQAKPLNGQVVYLKIPLSFFESKTTWGGMIFTARVEPSNGGVAINGDANWRLAGFPPMLQYKVKKFKTQAMLANMPHGPADIELEGTIINIKLSFPKGKSVELFPLIFATEAEIEAYRADTYKLLAAKFFDGTPFAKLSDDRKHALCAFANVTAAGTRMGSVTYKENLYLLVDLGKDSSIYNDLRFNQAQRIARVLNDRLLAVLKAFAMPVKDTKDIYGVKLEMEIPHKDFLKEYATPNLDKLEIYAPAELVQKFADADITSQQFIDGCVVIVNSNRISVPLASS